MMMKGSDKRILVVDDDDAIRSLLFIILRRRGFHVDTARNGEEALEHSRRCRYALMVLDLMMPRLSGYEVLDRMAEEPRDARPLIVVLTAGNEPRNLDPGLVAGTVRKPFDIEMLVDMIAGCIAARRTLPQGQDCPPPESESRQDVGDKPN